MPGYLLIDAICVLVFPVIYRTGKVKDLHVLGTAFVRQRRAGWSGRRR
jgi:hypothetical protein